MKNRSLVVPALFCTLLFGKTVFANDVVFTPVNPSTVFKAVNQTIVANSSIDISKLGTVTGLALSGKVTLASDKAFVRVVMVTTQGYEYLVLETNPLLAKGKNLDLDEYCEETRQLPSVTPSALRIEMKEASLTLSSVSISPSTASHAAVAAAGLSNADRDAQQRAKLLAVRYSIKQNRLHWAAGDTPVSRKSYAEKKMLFGGRMPNLAGLEYYIGGIFEVPSSAAATAAPAASGGPSPYVPNFSWRNKHGQDWLTPVTNQNPCGSCWAFAAVGATELQANLYFNRHLDLNLSEQQALSCMSGGSCAGGSPGPVLDYITNNGIFEESCFPYTATDQACSNECASPTENVKIGGTVWFNNDSEDTLKGMILTHATTFGQVNWWHFLTLAGYRTLKVGDSFYVRDYNGSANWIVITAQDTNLIGKTVWELKNSWGTWFGDNGYVWALTDLSNIYGTAELLTPVIRQGHTDAEILCVDADGDGYYAWGIGPKPATCPAGSSAQEDGDDSNRCLGPMDQYGNMTVLCPIVTADFMASSLSPCMGNRTTFTSLSTGPVATWSWNFGSGASPATATGRGPFTVTYSTSGTKNVVLSVTATNGAHDTKTKDGYITVPYLCNPYNLEVYAKNEGCTETNETKPRTYITSMGTAPVSNFKMVFKFTTNGKMPKLEDWYTPYNTPSLQRISGNTYKVVYNFAGYTLNPGGVVPDTSGDVIGLHYTDWSTWNVTTSFNPGCTFAFNSDLGIYDSTGNLIYGTPQ